MLLRAIFRQLPIAFALLAAVPVARSQVAWANPEYRRPIADRLAALPDLDARLNALQKRLDEVQDQTSISATTARYTLNVLKDALSNPSAYGPFPLPPPPPTTGPVPPSPVQYATTPPGKLSDYISTMLPFAIDLAGELQRAEQIAIALKGGRNPMAGATGDVHLAYRSSLDGMLLPFRLYVPTGYTDQHTWPLIVFLHGARCDENTFMAANQLQPVAERMGYLVAGVNGRGPVSGYTEGSGAHQDVLDVIALMQKHYRIDPNRIYLMGHSMGGIGAWQIGLKYRETFAALAIESGTRDMPGRDETLSSGRKIPILMTAGGKDAAFPPALAIDVYHKLIDSGYPAKVVEYPEDVHEATFFSSIPEVFGWFDKYSKVSP